MVFPASLDSSAIGMTIGVCVLFAAIGMWNARGIARAKGDKLNIVIRTIIFAVMIIAVGLSYWYSTIGYETRSKTLFIKKHNGTLKLSYTEMTDVRRVGVDEMKNLEHTFGVAGLFGYTGHYRNSSIGDMTFYATQQKNWVLIHTIKGEAIIVTPDEPDKFAKEISDIITPNN